MERLLIFGGSSRMGLATAKLALEAGFEVHLAGRNPQKLAQARESLGGIVQTHAVDLSDDAQTRALLAQLAPLHHVVVTVSAPGPATSIPDTSVEQAQLAFGRFWMSYRVLHLAPEHLHRTGSITLTSGSSSKTPAPGYGFWGTLHGSIEALARQAALELAPIRVNVVSPGGIGLAPDRLLVEHAGQPEDIGRAIVSLLQNPAITNVKLDVDGGERQGTWSGN